jgi:hypothetical protein
MSKLCILVLGPESSGTRLITRLLIAGGAVGDGDHDQRFDIEPPRHEPVAVWRRSIPHRHEWPNIGSMVDVLQARAYHVEAVVTQRDWWPMTQSQIGPHVADRHEAEANIRRAYAHIYGSLAACSVPFVTVSLEGLILRPHDISQWVRGRFGLDALAAHEAILDVDEKWWT